MSKSTTSGLPDSAKKYQPFRYPGGKSKLAANPAFQALLFPLAESGDTFYEGFVGSGAVTLAVALKFRDKKLVVCDKDVTISGFWELIANGTEAEVAELEQLITNFAAMAVVRSNKKAYRAADDPKRKPTDPPFEAPNLEKVEYFKKLRARNKAAEDKIEPPLSLVERAYHALFFNRTTFSGIAMSQPIGGYNQSSEWTIDCRYNAKLLVEKIRNLRSLLHGRLTVYNEDILKWLARIPEGVPLYLDPPYYVKGEALYPVAMQNFEHGDLAGSLSIRTNWVMSYDICDEIRDLYDNQNILEIPFRYSINGKKVNWNPQHEFLICSGELDTSKFEAELVHWKADVEARTAKAEAKTKAAGAGDEDDE